MSELSTIVESSGFGGAKPEAGIDNPNLKIALAPQGRLGRMNEWCSEWCSSILVKETRQALKSKQFIWTYFVLLLCVGVWTALGLTMAGDFDQSNYRAGRELLVGFWVILGFPLGLIVPFGAYRSLAREFEDGTIQLMSITTMKPYQIVIGKFGSAMLQMLTYLSVLAPCILFTYMLRGIALGQIVIGLMICVGGSICLTVLGLFLAGAIRSRALGIGASVLFVLLLGWVYYGWCAVSYELTTYGGASPWDEPEFWMAFFAIFAIFGSTALLLLVAAASQISFPADNRSTAIRMVMFCQQILFVAVLIVAVPVAFMFRDEFCLSMTFIIGHYWLVMGLLMIGENSVLSRRVQRTLPRTVFSRSLFSLFMPGSGRGFLFAVANLWACSLMLLMACYFAEYLVSEEVRDRYMSRMLPPGVAMPALSRLSMEAIVSTIVNGMFVTWFLSVIFLLIRFAMTKRVAEMGPGTGPLVSLILGGLFVAFLSIISFVIHYNTADYTGRNETSIWLIPNWYWAVVEISQGTSYFDYYFLFMIFALQACVVILIAFLVAARDLLSQPIAVPERVRIELQKTPHRLQEGESIDEIFGELKPKVEEG